MDNQCVFCGCNGIMPSLGHHRLLLSSSWNSEAGGEEERATDENREKESCRHLEGREIQDKRKSGRKKKDKVLLREWVCINEERTKEKDCKDIVEGERMSGCWEWKWVGV